MSKKRYIVMNPEGDPVGVFKCEYEAEKSIMIKLAGLGFQDDSLRDSLDAWFIIPINYYKEVTLSL